MLRTFGPKRDEIIQSWRQLLFEELHESYSPNIIRFIKSRRMEPPFCSPRPIKVFGLNVKGKELNDWAPMTDALINVITGRKTDRDWLYNGAR